MATWNVSKVYIWSARALAIAFAAFQSLFGLDVFGSDASFLQEFLAFLVHIIPSLVILLVVFLFWSRPDFSAYCFIAMAVFYTFFFHTYRDVLLFLVLSVPIALIGGLYLGAHMSKKGKGA